MLLLSTIVSQWTPKVVSFLLHRKNRMYTFSLTLLVTLSLQYLSNLTMLKQQLRHFYITGLSNLVNQFILSLIVDQNIFYTDMAHLCTLMGITHSHRTPYSPWTNGLVEVQNKNLCTHIRMFLQNTPKNWADQVHMYAFAHNSRPLPALNFSPHKLVFHIRF